MWMHATGAVLLGVAVLAVVLVDRLGPGLVGDRRPLPTITGPGYDPAILRDDRQRVSVSFGPDLRFGIVARGVLDKKGEDKRLTFDRQGDTNNTVIKIGTSEYIFGTPSPSNKLLYRSKELPKPYVGWSAAMEYQNEQVRVIQYVQIVPGATSLVPGEKGTTAKAVLDTVLIYYIAENYGTAPQTVGIRVLLDTFIGNNDGVPFTVPGEKGFVTTMAEFDGAKVPDYLEVVENPDDESDPGTIARVGLRGLQWGEVPLLDPARVRICRYPGAEDVKDGGAGKYTKWDWKPRPIGKAKDADSCVAVYWPEKDIGSKEKMHVAMTYGLGQLAITEQLALSVPQSASPKKEFVVTAYVYRATKGQSVKLDLPAGLELVEGSNEQTITEDARRTQIFWKVRAAKVGTYSIGATSGRSRAAPVNVNVQNRGIFG